MKSLMKLVILFILGIMLNILPAASQSFGSFTDPRDGKVYKTIKPGRQEWIAQNMNHANPNSWCYNNDPNNCDKFGRLYSYVGATQACPPGWRLPTMKDWDKLIEEAGPEESAISLREGGKSGFGVLLAGVRYDHGGFNHLNENAYFWSNVFADNEPAWVYVFGRTMHTVAKIQSFSGNGFSVRCIRR